MVVSAGMAPHQLCFDLIGREYLDRMLAKRVELLENTFGCLMWYSFAVHEAPKYKAEAFNPDIHECLWLGLQPDSDPDAHRQGVHVHEDEACGRRWRTTAPTVWCHSLVDPSYAPPGKHVVQNEQLGAARQPHTEKEWLEIKKRYADELIQHLAAVCPQHDLGQRHRRRHQQPL